MPIRMDYKRKNRYKVMSRHCCERYCHQKHERSSIIISIKSSWDRELPSLPMNDKNNVKHILSLSFDDCEFEQTPEYCMSYEDGEKIADFVNQHYNETELIIVHCDGGISRSAGVAAAIMRVKEGFDDPIFDNRGKHPNMTCYLRTLKGFRYI
ncbi:MAG: dual specificity protein phosphatase family protein [Butyrivibrio sp.]|nr:dual specificity protein phosphatase family protein [Butyrivibrio sp.]